MQIRSTASLSWYATQCRHFLILIISAKFIYDPFQFLQEKLFMKQIFTRFGLALVAMILFGLFLTACGGGDDETPPADDTPTDAPADTPTDAPADDPTEEPAPTETPVPPTETPVPPTATPEPTATPDPAAGFVSFESLEGGFKISHPEGWFNSELFGLAIFASAEELLDSPDPGEEGGVMVVITGPTDEFEEDFGSLDPVVVLDEGAGDLGLGEDAEIIEGPTAVTINGVDAATAVITSLSDNGTPLTTYLAILIDETRGAVAFGATPTETADEFIPIFETMATTIELMEPVVSEEPEELPTAGDDVELLETEGFLLFGDVMTAAVDAGSSSTWDFIGLDGEFVDIVVTPLTDALDVVVDVVNEAGDSILPDGPIDNNFGEEEILGLAIPESGAYYIIVTGFGSEDAGEYQLSFNETGVASSGSTTEGVSISGDIAYGDSINGSITAEDAAPAFSFAGNVGDIARVLVDPEGELDVVVDIVDADGESLVLAGTDNSFGSEVVAAQLPADGEYAVLVTPFDEGAVGDFEVTLEGPAGSVVFAGDTLEEAGEDHAFPFTAEEDELVYILVEPDGELDVVVRVFNEDTDEELIEIDRSFALEGVGYRVPEGGNYYFQVAGFVPDDNTEDGGENLGDYFVTLLGSERTLFELAFGDTVQGRFDTNEGYVEYIFGGVAGDTINLTLETTDASDGVLEIFDLDDNSLASVDDAFSGEGEVLSYTFAEDGLVIIRVSDFFAGGGLFDLFVDAG
jgi:hypothetical protein